MADDVDADLLTVKRWLKTLREEHGLTQKELGQAIGRHARTVINAEDESEPALPQGWAFYLMLRELGVLLDAPPASQPTVSDRLAALEAQVAEGAKEVVLSLQDLAERVQFLERRAEPGGGSATGGLME